MPLYLSAVVGNCLTLKTLSGSTQLVSKGDLKKTSKYTSEKQTNKQKLENSHQFLFSLLGTKFQMLIFVIKTRSPPVCVLS